MPSIVRDKMGLRDAIRERMWRRRAINDNMTVVGTCHVQLFDENGVLKDERKIDNLVVTVGRDAIMERLDSSPSTAQPSHMAIGTGAVAPAAGNTALGAETDRNALTSSTASGAVLTMIGNWAAGDGTNAAITEGGVFNAASGVSMYSRATWAAINKGASDTLQITWTYTLTPS